MDQRCKSAGTSGVRYRNTKKIDSVMAELDESLSDVIVTSTVDLTIYDPVEKMSDGSPLRMVRSAETNLADFCTDAIRICMDADIGICNGGAIYEQLHFKINGSS